jgi:methionyl-tRNA formyltransferase
VPGESNDARFIERLARDLRPEVALSYDCLSVFQRPLLEAFEQAVNYHGGLLPHYRGVMATSFSILAGEAESGFTFHRMTEQVDAGPILEQGSVPVAGASSEDVSRRKLALAIATLPRVLDKVMARDPGSRPAGEGKRFHTRDWLALIRLEHPEYVTAAQIRQRLRAFGIVHLRIDGVEYPVTRVRAAASGEPRAFRTADRCVLAPDRFHGLPRWLYLLQARRARD